MTVHRHNRLAFHNNKWGFKGVEYRQNKGKFYAVIWHLWPRRTYLGAFDTPVQAAIAYDEAARRFYGAAAYLNFPQDGEKMVMAAPRSEGSEMCAAGHDLAEHGYTHERGVNCRLCNAEAQKRRRSPNRILEVVRDV